jgi:hypothetical protein
MSIGRNTKQTKSNHFYGQIVGTGRKSIPRARQHRDSGITVVAASWTGAIWLELRHDSKENIDLFQVSMLPHHGVGDSCSIASGVVGKYEQCTSWVPLKWDAYVVDGDTLIKN